MADLEGATYGTSAADDEMPRIPSTPDDDDEARRRSEQLTRIGDPNSWQITHVGENHPERSMLSAPAEVVTQRPDATGGNGSGGGASQDAPLQRIPDIRSGSAGDATPQRISAPASRVDQQGTASSGDTADVQRIPESKQAQEAKTNPNAQAQPERIPPKDTGRLERALMQYSQAQRDINFGTPAEQATARQLQIGTANDPQQQTVLRILDMIARAGKGPGAEPKDSGRMQRADMQQSQIYSDVASGDPELKKNALAAAGMPEAMQKSIDITPEEQALKDATAAEPAHGVLGRLKEIGKGYLYGGGIHGMIEGAADPKQLEQDIFTHRDLPRLAARAQIARGQLDDQLKRYDEIGRQTGIYPGTGQPTLGARAGEERMNLLMNKLVLSEQDKQELLRQGNVRLAYMGKRVEDAETNNKVHNILRAAQFASRQIAPEEREFIRQKTGVTLPDQFDPQSQFLKQDEKGRWMLLQAPKSRPGSVTVTDTSVRGMNRTRLNQEMGALKHYEASKSKYANDPKQLENLRGEFIRNRGWDPEKK